MIANPLRTRLQNGLPVFGITITTPSVEAAAHAATLGFHFLWVEMEHSPVTLETLRLIVLATRSLPAAVFARVPVVELWTAKRVLDQAGGSREDVFWGTGGADDETYLARVYIGHFQRLTRRNHTERRAGLFWIRDDMAFFDARARTNPFIIGFDNPL